MSEQTPHAVWRDTLTMLLRQGEVTPQVAAAAADEIERLRNQVEIVDTALRAVIATKDEEIERLRLIEHVADRVWRAYTDGRPMSEAIDMLFQALGPDVPPHLQGPV